MSALALPPEMPNWDRTNRLMRGSVELANRAHAYLDRAKDGDWQRWAMRSIRAGRASMRLMRWADRHVPRFGVPEYTYPARPMPKEAAPC